MNPAASPQRCSCGQTGELLSVDRAGVHWHARPTRERVARRIADDRGMHLEVARNVVAHVAEHGSVSPWAREVKAHAAALYREVVVETALRAVQAMGPVFKQLCDSWSAAARAAGRRGSYALAPPPDTRKDRL